MIENADGTLRPGVHPKDIDIYARETRSPTIKPFLDALEDWLDAPMTEDMDAFSAELDAICALLPKGTGERE